MGELVPKQGKIQPYLQGMACYFVSRVSKQTKANKIYRSIVIIKQ